MVGSGRRSTRALRALVPTLLLFVAAGALSAEVRPTAGVEVYETVFRQADDEWRLASNGLGRVTLAGTGSRNVRGELSIRFPTTTLPIPQIERAYLRFRLPWFRSTLGAAPLSWGEGILLNEADFPNLGYDPAQDFLSGDYRANALWQAQVYVPIGPLAFVEAVVLPALPDPTTTLAALAGAEPGAGTGGGTGTGGTADPSTSAAAFSTELHEISAGARLYVDAGPVALQAGYFWDASRHRFSASVHGALGVDVYLSVAHVLAETSSGFADDLIDGTTLSGGAFHVFSLPLDQSLSVRLEGAVRPADIDDGLPSGATIGTLVDYSVSPTVTVGLQSLVRPTDPSALVASNVSWSIDQGLTLLAAATATFGPPDSDFATDRTGSPAFTLGARYVY